MKPENVTEEQKAAMLAYLLKLRTHNYGYDYRDFRRIVYQRARARKAVRECERPLNWLGTSLSSRLDWQSIDYTVGQSQNEEITNLLMQLTGYEGEWLS